MMRMQLPDGEVFYDDSSPSYKSENSGCGALMSVTGVAAVLFPLFYGPLDLTRTGYNYCTGNLSTLKSELLEYTRANVQRENPLNSPQEIESKLAASLDYKLTSERITPGQVSIEKLWDASEDHASSLYQRWIWTHLE